MNQERTSKLMEISGDLGKIQDLVNRISMLKEALSKVEEAGEYWYIKYKELKRKLESFLDYYETKKGGAKTPKDSNRKN